MSEVFSHEVLVSNDLHTYRVIYVATPDRVACALLGEDGTVIPRATIQAKVEAASKSMREWPRA